jgi:hypothetical protein
MFSFYIISFLLFQLILLLNSAISTLGNVYFKKSILKNNDTCKNEFKSFGCY